MKLKTLGEKVEDDEEEEEDDNEEELEGLNGNTNENEATKATSDSVTENVEAKRERPDSPRAELELKEEIDVD